MAAVNARLTITLERDMSDESFTQFVNGVGAFIRSQNRIGNVQITVEGGGAPPPPPGTVVEGRWVDMREGYLSLGKNELHDICTSVDAGAIRIASATPEPNLGFFGFDSLRERDHRLELTSFILGKRREDRRSLGRLNLFGELQFWARDPDLAPLNDDQQFKCAMSITARRVKVYVPVEGPGVGAIEAAPALPPEIARRVAGKG